jgi:23S rRNA (guanosine2251-2'-O)-methyltransferase
MPRVNGTTGRAPATPDSGRAGQTGREAQDGAMVRPPPSRSGGKPHRPGGKPQRPDREGPPRPKPGAPKRPGAGSPPPRRPQPVQEEPREAEAGPRPRGRDRRGLGDPRPARVPEAPSPAPRHAGPKEVAPPGTIWLHGLHAVAAALANPRRRVKRLLLTDDAHAELARRLPPPWRASAERVERNRFQTFLPEDSVHQGAAALVEPLPAARLEEAIAASAGPVLVLDQVTDPRNVGAILRSAAAFGAACVVMQDRHAPPETGALARAASGALEIVPVAREVNLSRAIVALQRAGFWVLGLAGEGGRALAGAVPRDRRVALVLGAEDAGLRRLQRETCDELVRLPMAPGVESLNVAAAAAVALYEIARGDDTEEEADA